MSDLKAFNASDLKAFHASSLKARGIGAIIPAYFTEQIRFGLTVDVDIYVKSYSDFLADGGAFGGGLWEVNSAGTRYNFKSSEYLTSYSFDEALFMMEGVAYSGNAFLQGLDWWYRLAIGPLPGRDDQNGPAHPPNPSIFDAYPNRGDVGTFGGTGYDAAGNLLSALLDVPGGFPRNLAPMAVSMNSGGDIATCTWEIPWTITTNWYTGQNILAEYGIQGFSIGVSGKSPGTPHYFATVTKYVDGDPVIPLDGFGGKSWSHDDYYLTALECFPTLTIQLAGDRLT